MNMKQSKIILILLFLISSFIYLPSEKVSAYGNNTSLDDVDASFVTESYALWNNGSSASIIGDVNGDGYDDIAIAKEYILNPGNSFVCPTYEKAYLFFGKKDGWIKDINLNNADASFYTFSSDTWDIEVTGVGDVNKDNFDDFLIGIPEYQGRAYLIFGKSSGWVKDFNLSNAKASFIDINDEVWDHCFGSTIAGTGDVNGDGYDDFIIGMDGGGKAFLYFGRASNWHKNITTNDANASYLKEKLGGWSGINVAGTGDVNNDGYDDILVGHPYYDEEKHDWRGKTYLIFGKKDGWAVNQSLDLASNASFIGENKWDFSGWAISNSGDINGDDFDDILISSCCRIYNDNPQSKTYAIFGKSMGWQKNMSLSNANASFIGESDYDWAGHSLSSSGDVNGDGFDDIILGAPGNDSYHSYDGKTYVILGKASGWSQNFSLANVNASFIGEGDFNLSGSYVSSSGDVNGDGFDDILTSNMGNSTYYWPWTPDIVGETYLIFYDTNTKPTSISFIALYSDSYYSVETTEADIDQTVFVELIGNDGDLTGKNVAEVQVTSSITDTYGIEVRLHETAVNSGIYRGSFKIANVSSQYHNRIGAGFGETVQVTSKQDPTKYDTILVKVADVKILPKDDNETAIEDQLYKQQYSTLGGLKANVIWTFESNASWLNWNASNQTIFGIPTNDDVGQYWVRINISYKSQSFDEHNFTLTVININDPPEIIGAPEILGIKALQDYQLDLSNYIFDVDNSRDELIILLNSYYATVRNHTIIFNYPDSVESENVKFNVTDGVDFSNDHVINVTVIPQDVQLPTVLNKSPIGENVSTWSNITIIFSKSMDQISVENAITVFPIINDTFFSWFGDNTTVTFFHNTPLAYNQTYNVNISASAEDTLGNYLDGNNNGVFEDSPIDEYSWTFITIGENVTPNNAPSIQIDSPLNLSTFNFNDTIYFDCVNTTDPDGDLLEFLWISNISGILSYNPQFTTNLPIGHHQITLYVNDGHGHNISESINIIITPWNRPPIAIITSPLEGEVFNITDFIQFDASSSYDLDLDTLDFYWHSNISGGFGYISQFTAKLPEGRHLITLSVNDGFYHNVSVSINITVIDPSTGPPGPGDTKPPPTTQDDSFYSTYGLYIGIIIVILLVTIFGFAAATEVGKYGVLGTMVPLYRRLKGKKVLDNETRGMVRGYILANPGEHYSIIKRTLKLPNGTLTYHLKVLEQEGLVKSERDGIYKRFYPIEMQLPKNATYLTRIQESILNEIITKPGITVSELGKKIEVNPRVINYHMKALVSAGLIKAERFGKKNRYYVVDEINKI